MVCPECGYEEEYREGIQLCRECQPLVHLINPKLPKVVYNMFNKVNYMAARGNGKSNRTLDMIEDRAKNCVKE